MRLSKQSRNINSQTQWQLKWNSIQPSSNLFFIRNLAYFQSIMPLVRVQYNEKREMRKCEKGKDIKQQRSQLGLVILFFAMCFKHTFMHLKHTVHLFIFFGAMCSQLHRCHRYISIFFECMYCMDVACSQTSNRDHHHYHKTVKKPIQVCYLGWNGFSVCAIFHD